MHGCRKFTAPLFSSPPPKFRPTFFPRLENLIWPPGPLVKVREGFKKKNVKLGLLAEVRGGEGSEWVLGAQPVIRSVF